MTVHQVQKCLITRRFVDSRNIRPDPCDNQIIRCYNMMVCLQCVFELAACLSGDDDLPGPEI